MTTDLWLNLTDYASMYRISISTLRRQIKSGQLEHRVDGSRYLIRAPAPAVTPDSEVGLKSTASEVAQEERMLSSASGLLREIKTAYTAVLQEREAQIQQLKGEVMDLRILVGALEEEIDRLRQPTARYSDSFASDS